jgi:universal stress protein A
VAFVFVRESVIFTIVPVNMLWPIFAMKTLLLPLDFSDATRAVLQVARDLLTMPGGHVILLHCLPPPLVTNEFGLGLGLVQETMAAHQFAAQGRLEDLARTLRAEGITAECVLKDGAPAREALNLAGDRHVDAIVVGSHGHTAFYDLLVGGTTQAMLRKATCPVVVVPPALVATADEAPLLAIPASTSGAAGT